MQIGDIRLYGAKYASTFNATEHTAHNVAIKETLDWFKQN